jgi:uncharacterized protein (DUF433 family)
MSFVDRAGHSLIGVGVYTLPQAARLVRLPAATVEGIVGPEPISDTPPRLFPVAIAELDLGFDDKIVTFQGLMELWVAAQLRAEGIEWPVIRLAAYQASKILHTRHPLSTGAFRTERKKVFLSLKIRSRQPKTAVDLLNRQHVFEEVVDRSLRPSIAVRDPDGRIKKLFPLGATASVVLDPTRRFGEPIDPESGVPTTSLASAYYSEGRNVAAAAQWFEVSKKAVQDAVKFEEWLSKN